MPLRPHAPVTHLPFPSSVPFFQADPSPGNAFFLRPRSYPIAACSNPALLCKSSKFFFMSLFFFFLMCENQKAAALHVDTLSLLRSSSSIHLAWVRTRLALAAPVITPVMTSNHPPRVCCRPGRVPRALKRPRPAAPCGGSYHLLHSRGEKVTGTEKLGDLPGVTLPGF